MEGTEKGQVSISCLQRQPAPPEVTTCLPPPHSLTQADTFRVESSSADYGATQKKYSSNNTWEREQGPQKAKMK